MIELRDYQEQLVNQGLQVLKKYDIVYYAIEMRVGKTLIALETAQRYKAKKVLFVTKKKAISSIQKDFKLLGAKYEIDIINYEALDKYKKIKYDLIIIDEAHSLGAFPKPSLRTKELREMSSGLPIIYLSGTPTPESYSQIFHQLWVSSFSPFDNKNFYAWSKDFTYPYKQRIGGFEINKYDRANETLIKEKINHLLITYTQEEAGFKQAEIEEIVKTIPVDNGINTLINILAKKKYYKFKDGNEIVCDSAVKVQNKIHQLSSGTIILDTGEGRVLDYSKAFYIKEHYSKFKIAIYYKFQAELEAIKSVFSNLCFDPDTFCTSNDKIFVSQIQSGSMGVNLSSADYLIFYNIDFSATQYWQARARLSDFKRETPPKIVWLFNEQGIENKVYKAVVKKKNYTSNYFKRDYAI